MAMIAPETPGVADNPAACGQTPQLGVKLAVVGVPAMVALVIALIGLGRRQLWRDEFATWVDSTMSYRELYQLIHRTDAVLAPYYVFTHVWINVFGDSTISLRIPSVLAASAAAGLTAEIGRRLFGADVGLLAGLLLAILPSISRYGQEARPYALAVAATALATLLLVRAVEAPSSRRWVPYAVSVMFIGWTHLVALAVLLAHGLYVLTTWRQRHGGELSQWSIAVIGGIVPVLPLIWLGSGQSAQVSWIPETTWRRIINETLEAPGYWLVGVAVCGLALLGFWRPDRQTCLAAVWALGPFLLLYSIGPFTDLLAHRYVLFTLPGWSLLAARGVCRVLRAVPGTGSALAPRLIAIAFVVLGFVALGLPTLRTDRDIVVTREPDLRGIADLIATRAKSGDFISYHGEYPWWSRTAMTYYVPADRRLPTAFLAVTGRPASYTKECPAGQCLEHVTRLWLINDRATADPFERVEPGLSSSLRQKFEVLDVTRATGVTVTLLVRRPTTSSQRTR